MLKRLLSSGDEPEPPAVSVPFDALLDIAQSERRRQCLRTVNEHGRLELTDLAEVVAAAEVNTTRDQLQSQQRKRVYVSLYQTHIAKLDNTGLVRWSQTNGTVCATAETGPAVDALNDLADRTTGGDC
ncbi:DUF7344 domain-containing protein [Haloarcula marismortui]|uniref:DUF7344 domain-containing protein n=1 Tax=Haloarcula marismortui ATCC 33800 TaxID=662476 RepID=M0JGN1_9EURY|nr:hypothetical protein [Haloarcula sinaiiensis]EMA08141.1 hypothetical protein C436_20623 [Haloarcula sinaiiensis ATCC 33800]QUJ73993.1 hypothetical protein KDQ40_18665 [Haloarcula sinaiiensis ATCC 33800]